MVSEDLLSDVRTVSVKTKSRSAKTLRSASEADKKNPSNSTRNVMDKTKSDSSEPIEVKTFAPKTRSGTADSLRSFAPSGVPKSSETTSRVSKLSTLKKAVSNSLQSDASDSLTLENPMSSNNGNANDAELVAPRRMNVVIQRISPLSAAKIAFPLSLVVGLILTVAVMSLWLVLNLSGMFSSIANWVSGSGFSSGQVDVLSILGFGNILAFMLILSVIFTVTMTILSVIFALIYNQITKMVGGLRITLGDD
ncbi:MAG: DUF3566 domain-containing protein [Bifidobacteriaceae bacterium]|jgi:hypothetical protein|nr:DUF3566 domain-containing protein [Bifidobacteriaceae bacterium]